MYVGRALFSLPALAACGWGDTWIRGNVCRGTGILNNELYAGVLVWKRQRLIGEACQDIDVCCEIITARR
ncbi:hypothetical protein [Mesorhizobium xinjiangense]|uniref:hypothetical protein n=1 Tax=Mesorhizobium xinjiangense TaxID=2678685 RepID=UPI0018DC129A|nr:hypothetical protein [Mesorhizobium xinjiangense]